MKPTTNQVDAAIRAFMADRTNNAMEPGADLPAFDPPLVGVASGADPLFPWLKGDIGDFLWTPVQAFGLAFPNEPALEDELSVVAWILPQTPTTRKAHKHEHELPSREWSCVRYFGERINEVLRRYVVAWFAEHGVRAVAPVLMDQWGKHLSAQYGFASTWSERHAAHVCGLGTFGLSDGLITPAGKAVRVGSVVVNARLEPTVRPYKAHDQWCLRAAGVECTACIRRCPAGAISERGHDKEKCKAYIRGVTSHHVEREQLGIRVNSCGLCQVGVPCEGRNPTEKIKK